MVICTGFWEPLLSPGISGSILIFLTVRPLSMIVAGMAAVENMSELH